VFKKSNCGTYNVNLPCLHYFIYVNNMHTACSTSTARLLPQACLYSPLRCYRSHVIDRQMECHFKGISEQSQTVLCGMKSLFVVCDVCDANLFMAILCSRCGHYIFVLWFLSSSFFIPRLISAVADWMCTILLHMVWP